MDEHHSNLARNWHGERPWPTEIELAELREKDRLDIEDLGRIEGSVTFELPMPGIARAAGAMNNEPTSLMVELWFEDEPQLDPADVCAAVPGTERQGDLIIHPRFVQEFVEGEPAALGTALLRGSRGEQQPSADQTWDWEHAGEVLARCSHSLLVAELLGRYHPFRDRLEAYVPTLRAVVELTARPRCGARTAPGSCGPRSSKTSRPWSTCACSASKTSLLMDTLGLHVLGLRDFQCRCAYGDRDPNEIAGALLDLAGYALEHGDVVEDGDTTGEEYWRCRHVESVAAPPREVVDLELP